MNTLHPAAKIIFYPTNRCSRLADLERGTVVACVAFFASILLLTKACGAAPAQPQENDSTPGTEAPSAASEGAELGSTATLETIRKQSRPADQRESEEPPVWTLHSAPVPEPALRYRLWPKLSVLEPGQAATHFYRALIFASEFPEEEQKEVARLISSDTLDKDQLAKAEELLKQRERVFEELEQMALKQDQTWLFPLDQLEGAKLYAYLMPDVQQARDLAKLLALRARYQIAQENFEDAIDTLLLGFRLAAFVGQGETLVKQLVGIAIAEAMFSEIEKAIQLKRCPNLYWALATLPRPIVDWRRSFEFEADAIFQVFPFLDDAEERDWSDEKWKAEILNAITQVDDLLGLSWRGRDSDAATVFASLLFASDAQVAEAKERLNESGHDPRKLAKLSPYQILIMDISSQLQTILDMTYRGVYLPPEQALTVLASADSKLNALLRESNPTPAAVIAGLLVPLVEAAYRAQVRSQLNANRLMTIEAIRSSLASGNPRLPESLEVLKVPPPLVDPFTGRLFRYSLRSWGEQREAVLTVSEESRLPKRRVILRAAK